MLRIILVLPGATDLDSQGRIKGSLDLPMNASGNEQAKKTARALQSESIDLLYSSPCLSAQQTAEQLSRDGQIKIKTIDNLRNLDRGLWHGRLIEELKESQPKIFRLWQEQPQTIRPPGGESLDEAEIRVEKAVRKIRKKHKSGTIAMVVPEPLASVIRSHLDHADIGDLWQAECRSGGWETINVASESVN